MSKKTETQDSKAESKNEMTFEAAFERLQQVVRKLEAGDTPLEESIKSFEEGVRLTRFCQEHLSAAEKKVELLTKVSEKGEPEFKPF